MVCIVIWGRATTLKNGTDIRVIRGGSVGFLKAEVLSVLTTATFLNVSGSNDSTAALDSSLTFEAEFQISARGISA
jgi:hypothetical protein